MNREEFYLTIAPIYAVYLAQLSASEALKHTARDVEDIEPKYARELMTAGLMPSPAARLTADKLAAVRQLGFAASNEEAGVPKAVLVNSFLQSMKAIALGRLEASMQQFTGLFSSLASLMFAPLLLLFLYAFGLLGMDLSMLLALAGLFSLTVGLLIYRAMPRDLSPVKTYGPALYAAVAAGAAGAAFAVAYQLPPALGPLLAGVVLAAWLLATKRYWWFLVSHEVPAMLRDFASRIAQGIPADLALREISATYKTAWMVAYFYRVPSLMFAVAKAMYNAISWAGPNLLAIDYLQTLLDEKERNMRRVTALTLAFIALYIGAVLVLEYAMAVSTTALQAVPASGEGLLSPLPPQQVKLALAQVLSSMVSGFVAVTLMPSRGIWLGMLIGGLAGLVIFYAAHLLWGLWALPANFS